MQVGVRRLTLDDVAALFECGADPVPQLPLKLNAVLGDCSAGSTGPLQLLTQLLEEYLIARQAMGSLERPRPILSVTLGRQNLSARVGETTEARSRDNGVDVC